MIHKEQHRPLLAALSLNASHSRLPHVDGKLIAKYRLLLLPAPELTAEPELLRPNLQLVNAPVTPKEMLAADLEHCMGDMNSHPEHLRQYLRGVIVEAFYRQIGCATYRAANFFTNSCASRRRTGLYRSACTGRASALRFFLLQTSSVRTSLRLRVALCSPRCATHRKRVVFSNDRKSTSSSSCQPRVQPERVVLQLYGQPWLRLH